MYTHKNYTREFPRTTNIAASPSLFTNLTTGINEIPAISRNKHAFSNHSTTDSTNNSFYSTASLEIVIPVVIATFIAIVVIAAWLYVRKPCREKATDVQIRGQSIHLMEHDP